jgi:hypothetical protein
VESARISNLVTSSAISDQVFELGNDYAVDIEIVLWDEYQHLFHQEAPLELFEGNKMIARGTFDRL